MPPLAGLTPGFTVPPAAGMVAPFETMTIKEFRRVRDVTLMGQVHGAKVVLPYLKQTGQGSLIAVSSMERRRALPLQSAYSTAKHWLEGFLESLRVELEHEGQAINVISIKPAVINTPFYNHARTKIGVKPTGIPPTTTLAWSPMLFSMPLSTQFETLSWAM